MPRPNFTQTIIAHRRSPGLRQRIMSLLAMVWLVALLLIVGSVVIFVSRTERMAWRGRQTEAALNAAQTVADFITDADTPLILTGLMGRDELAADPAILEQLIAINPALQEVVYVDATGHVLAGVAQDTPLLSNQFTIPQSQWFLKSSAGQHYHSGVQFSAADEPYMILAVPTLNGGVVATRLRMDVFWDIVSNIHFGQTGNAYVVTHSGQIIAHTNREVVLANTNISHRPEFKAILQVPNCEWAGDYTDLHGTPVVVVTTIVPDTDWIIVTELPQREAFAVSRLALIWMGSAMTLLGIFILWQSNRTLSRLLFTPLETLQTGVEYVGQGHLDYQITVTGEYEIGQLTAAFNQMAASLHQEQALLEQRNIQLELIYQAGLSLISNLDLKKVLDVILVSTFKLLPHMEDVHLFLYADERLHFASSLWRDGRKDHLFAEPRPEGTTYTVARTGQPIVISDVQYDLHSPQPPTNWQGALAGIPLKIGERVVGVINVAFAQPRTFLAEELRVLQLLGDKAAIAIENARLYEHAQEMLAERLRAEAALQRAHDELEERVQARTAELAQINETLVLEIAERERVETQIKNSLQEKEVLLKEIHHRVKNNLQVVSSLLRLQASSVTDAQTLGIFRDSQTRIQSMALIHEKLYRSSNLAQIDFGDYIRSLVSYLFRSQRVSARGIGFHLEADTVVLLEIDKAVPCGLIINELVSNSLKHAFPNGKRGTVQIALHIDNDQTLTVKISDDGSGFPDSVDFRNTESLGLQLVNTLVDQIDGTIELSRIPRTTFTIVFAYP